MPSLVFSPPQLSAAVRVAGAAFDPPPVRAQAVPSGPQSVTQQATVSGAAAALSKLGSAAWLTVPAESTDGVAFDVTIDATELAAGDYAETVRAEADGFDPADCVISLAVRPEGPPPR